MADAAIMQEMLALDLKEEADALAEGEAGDPTAALALYSQAISYAPNFRLYVARCAVLLRLGRPDEAALDASSIVTLLPSWHRGHALAAAAAAAMGQAVRAREAFDKAAFLARGAPRCAARRRRSAQLTRP
jgi:tetratricopeptide (TPR) repeat protein